MCGGEDKDRGGSRVVRKSPEELMAEIREVGNSSKADPEALFCLALALMVYYDEERAKRKKLEGRLEDIKSIVERLL